LVRRRLRHERLGRVGWSQHHVVGGGSEGRPPRPAAPGAERVPQQVRACHARRVPVTARASAATEREAEQVLAQRQGRSRRGGTPPRAQRRHRDNEGILPILAKAAREIESRAQRGELLRTTFQVVAVLAREERIRVKSDPEISESRRDAELKRLDGIAKILGQVAGAQPELFELLDENAELTDSARALKREMQLSAGLEPEPEPEKPRNGTSVHEARQVVPRSVVAAQLANPFLAPDASGAEPRLPDNRRL